MKRPTLQEPVTLRESLSELTGYAELVMKDLNSTDTGWYYHMLASIQQANRTLFQKQEEKG